ncbi:hypothetical protein [Rahnella inusitata]|uniref:hypothetical protein n=1 Tax=Rahnella inusitata TaxID=58169 RepID=UPI0039BDF42C
MENQSAVLLRRLNPYCAQALEAAATLCQTRAHNEITVKYWLLKLLEMLEMLRAIVEIKLTQVAKCLNKHYSLTCSIEESLYDTLVAACLLPDTGARNIDSLLNQQILPVLSQQLLQRMAGQQRTTALALSWVEEEGITLEFDGEEK